MGIVNCSAVTAPVRLAKLWRQHTLGTTAVVTGTGGFDGQPAEVLLRPAPPNCGIRLLRGGKEALVGPDCLAVAAELAHTTSLRVGPTFVVTVEHLFAALAAFSITNVVVEVGASGHVPLLDGSAAGFCEAVLDAGVVAQDGDLVNAVVVQQPICVVHGDATALVLPPRPGPSTKLRIALEIDFPYPIGRQAVVYEHSLERFLLSFASARTFMAARWNGSRVVSALPGFYHRHGPSRETNMVTHDGLRYRTDLRMPNECAAHKVVDALGDLTVLGIPVCADIFCYRPGHALLHAVVRRIGALMNLARSSEAA